MINHGITVFSRSRPFFSLLQLARRDRQKLRLPSRDLTSNILGQAIAMVHTRGSFTGFRKGPGVPQARPGATPSQRRTVPLQLVGSQLARAWLSGMPPGSVLQLGKYRQSPGAHFCLLRAHTTSSRWGLEHARLRIGESLASSSDDSRCPQCRHRCRCALLMVEREGRQAETADAEGQAAAVLLTV